MPKPIEGLSAADDAGILVAAIVMRPSTAVDRLVPVHGEPSPIGERAIEQHAILVRTLRDRGVAVTELEPVLASSAEALIADGAIILPQGAVIARPGSVERRAEVPAIEAALSRSGIPIAGRITAPGLLDAMDVTRSGETLYVGVSRPGGGLRARSNALGRGQLAEFARTQNLRVVELALAPAVLRLRNVLSFVAGDTAIVAAELIDTGPLVGVQLIAVPRGEEYAAGLLALGNRRVIANLRFRESLKLLRQAKISVEAIDLWEYGKAGAGPFSLVLATKRR